MGQELHLAHEETGPVLNRIVFTLNDCGEELFVRWSAVNAIKNIIEREQNPEEKRMLAKVLLGKPFAPSGITVYAALTHVITDPASATRLDPDISVKVANTLEMLGDLLSSVEENDKDKAQLAPEKKKLGREVVNLLNEVFYMEPGGDIRFDVETRNAVMKAIVSIGGANTTGGIHTLVLALNDPDVRIRRDAAKTLNIYSPAAGKDMPDVSGLRICEKVIPALTLRLAG